MKVNREGFLKSLITEELQAIIDLRHQLHQIPELAFQEHQTTQLLQSFIRDTPHVRLLTGIAKTGFTATLFPEKTGKCIAFRADMDALPILETTGVVYASQHEGCMHACGHDGHSAILAGLVRVLSRCGEQLNGPVKFIFQPAEEGGCGAKYMVEAGVLEQPRVDAMFGLHGWPTLNLGQVGATEGPCFASTNSFDICIQGRSGHAAFPHHTVDPMPIAAGIISSLQTLVSRSTNPLESAVLSICEVRGGNTYNVIPDEVVLKGTLRCFDQGLRGHLLGKLEKMVVSIAHAFGATASLRLKPDAYPALINDLQQTRFFMETAKQVMGQCAVVTVPPSMGGEDFAFYANEVPSCFWLLGVKDPAADSWPFLHTSNYNFNDQALEIAIRIQAEIALGFQQRT